MCIYSTRVRVKWIAGNKKKSNILIEKTAVKKYLIILK